MARITTVDRLLALIGEPKPAVAKKFQTHLTAQAREFLARSPLAFVATVYPSWRASRVNPAEALRYE